MNRAGLTSLLCLAAPRAVLEQRTAVVQEGYCLVFQEVQPCQKTGLSMEISAHAAFSESVRRTGGWVHRNTAESIVGL